MAQAKPRADGVGHTPVAKGTKAKTTRRAAELHALDLFEEAVALAVLQDEDVVTLPLREAQAVGKLARLGAFRGMGSRTEPRHLLWQRTVIETAKQNMQTLVDGGMRPREARDQATHEALAELRRHTGRGLSLDYFKVLMRPSKSAK